MNASLHNKQPHDAFMSIRAAHCFLVFTVIKLYLANVECCVCCFHLMTNLVFFNAYFAFFFFLFLAMCLWTAGECPRNEKMYAKEIRNVPLVMSQTAQILLRG